jgi:hypothetical protein
MIYSRKSITRMIGPPGNTRGRTASSRRRGIVDYSAIGVVASALADATHEILGHVAAA